MLTGFRVMGQPYLMENGTASCIYSAVERSCLDVAIGEASTLSASVPFLLYVESPDACRSNLRKQLAVQKKLPPCKNCVYFRSKCTCHQGHRIVLSAERKRFGDAHAIVVACGHPAHAVKLQASLKKVLSRTVVIPGDPPSRLGAVHRNLVQHTILRRVELIQSDPNVDQSVLDRLEKVIAAVPEFSALCNGDWSSPWPIHYLNGSHASKEEVIDHMFACCCEVDLLCVNEPNVSSDDWGICGSANGKIGLGYVCHSLLPTSVSRSASVLDSHEASS